MPPDNLKRKFSRSAARSARIMQTLYRRSRPSASTDQRQLSSVIRSHRKANPYQITPSSGRTVTFWRKTQISYSLNQLTGFQAAGNNVNFGFSLGRLIGFTNGTFQISQPMPQFSEFQELFDYYKINAVKLQIFFTKNTADLSGGSTQGMPLLLLCNDFDDIAEPMTRESMMQRVGCRHVQFDASNVNGIAHYIKPKPATVLVQTNVADGTLTSSNSGVQFGTQWVDTASSNIVHNGIKVLYDNQGVTTSTVLGNITFVFDVCFEFKGYR